MNARHILIPLTTSLLALSAGADSALAGKSFQIDMVTIGEPGITSSCVRFDKDGTMDMAHNALELVWTQPYGARDEFVAVSVVNPALPRQFHLGSHGILVPGNVLLGTSIDQNGSAVGYLGSEVKRCAFGRPVLTPTRQCVSAAAAARGATERALIDCAPPAYVDAAAALWSPPADTDGSDTATGRSRLSGRSFMVTMNDSRTPAQCWSFDERGALRTSRSGTLTWAPDFLYDVRDTFQAITTGVGFAQTFYGGLVGDALLDVRGIRDVPNRSRDAYGVGFEVARCASP